MITNDFAGFNPITTYSDWWIQNRNKQLGRFLLVLMLVAAPWTAAAQETQATSQANQAEQVSPVVVPTAPVLLDGEILFHVRGVSAYPADVRAQKISERIGALL